MEKEKKLEFEKKYGLNNDKKKEIKLNGEEDDSEEDEEQKQEQKESSDSSDDSGK